MIDEIIKGKWDLRSLRLYATMNLERPGLAQTDKKMVCQPKPLQAVSPDKPKQSENMFFNMSTLYGLADHLAIVNRSQMFYVRF